MSALTSQVSGSHYKSGIQPIEYIHANKLDFFEGNAVKYITRHKSKNGEEDIKKALHYCQLILELTYGIKTSVLYQEEKEHYQDFQLQPSVKEVPSIKDSQIWLSV